MCNFIICDKFWLISAKFTTKLIASACFIYHFKSPSTLIYSLFYHSAIPVHLIPFPGAYRAVIHQRTAFCSPRTGPLLMRRTWSVKFQKTKYSTSISGVILFGILAFYSFTTQLAGNGTILVISPGCPLQERKRRGTAAQHPLASAATPVLTGAYGVAHMLTAWSGLGCSGAFRTSSLHAYIMSIN